MNRLITALSDFVIEKVAHENPLTFQAKFIGKVELGISYASIERYYHEMTIAKNKHLLTMQCPEILGIDEHRFSKKMAFLTTFCDLKKHRIYDIAMGKSNAELADFLSKLRGREKVKVICIDMNSAYRSLIKKWYPRTEPIIKQAS